MQSEHFSSDNSLQLRDVASPRELTTLLSSYAALLKAPVWITNMKSEVFASSSDAKNKEYRKTLPFQISDDIADGLPEGVTVNSENEQVLVVPINLPEGVAGFLATTTRDGFDREKIKILLDLIDALLRVGWKNTMTSEMHSAAMNVSHRELEEQNRRLNGTLKKLKTLDEAKTTFMQTVSHELKTPLTSIIGYAELLAEGVAGELNAEQKEYSETILEKGQALLDMITNVLDITRLGAGREDLELNFHTIEDITTQAIDSNLTAAKGKNITINVEQGEGLKPVFMDAVRVSRALAALISNAIKFSPENSTVTIRASLGPHERIQPAKTPFDMPEEDVLAISVEDKGIGVLPEEINKIFDSFYQVDNSSTREFGGTGLGLTLAKNFVDSHMGKIEVISAPDRGSRFTILIPVEIQD